ncbi:MAG: acetyl-CoA carboxylase biotin carboxyl carrier protein subunit [Bacteroidetes bacterium]|nr:acetyl-CoA carboxylase biotin carboxyl carrier protein subunit [Bacteroidota bacterium]HET6243751.1 acetyl-CoA carboxylase biotin carboxyl carrier protein subunit [Bacteroidia bacterium]
MLKIKINDKKEHLVEITPSGTSGIINEDNFTLDLLKVKEGNYHILRNNKSYNVEIISADYQEKCFTIKVNGNKYQLAIKNKYDDLLKSMGMQIAGAGKINEIKAPMPGLVLEILVSPGQEVQKGDPVMVLEAMKMENILKSPADGIVKKVNVEQKQAVEKNQVLINFE